jgi:hypothetical protein
MSEDKSYVEMVGEVWYESTFGSTEELTADNFIEVSEEDYDTETNWDTEIEELDLSVAKPGLWENIRKKKEREGKKYRPAKPGDKDRPDPEAWKKAGAEYVYENPKTGERFNYIRQGNYKKDGVALVYKGKAAEYQGRKVTLNKPFLTPDGPKKRSVYVRNDKGNIVKVNFGSKEMKIRKSNPEARKSFRARHKCDTNPGPKWKAKYWSCLQWIVFLPLFLMF